jgi:mono/diheme cytochrome c family protein
MMLAALLTSALRIAPAERTGRQVFETVCSMCHVEASATPMRAPLVSDLRRLTRQNIIDALTIGEMTDVGNGLSGKEIEAVATYLTAALPKPSQDPAAQSPAGPVDLAPH